MTPKIAADQVSYEDLYARWEQGNWRATEIDFTVDRDHWNNTFTEMERRAALLGAIEDIRGSGADFSALDARHIKGMERTAGLKDLRFETEPIAGDREKPVEIDVLAHPVDLRSRTAVHPDQARMQRSNVFVDRNA